MLSFDDSCWPDIFSNLHRELIKWGGCILPVGAVWGWYQDLLEVLRGGGKVCTYFWIIVMGHNALHSEGVVEPA